MPLCNDMMPQPERLLPGENSFEELSANYVAVRGIDLAAERGKGVDHQW